MFIPRGKSLTSDSHSSQADCPKTPSRSWHRFPPSWDKSWFSACGARMIRPTPSNCERKRTGSCVSGCFRYRASPKYSRWEAGESNSKFKSTRMHWCDMVSPSKTFVRQSSIAMKMRPAAILTNEAPTNYSCARSVALRPSTISNGLRLRFAMDGPFRSPCLRTLWKHPS